jgi:branched-chain amino acid transport system ATP-binding protein
MFKVNSVNIFYGVIRILRDVSITIDQGELVTLIGSNGAGKSTLLNGISGIIKLHSGTIQFMGTDITRKRPNEIVKLGIVHAPEGKQLFGSLTVMENLELGAYLRFNWRNNKSEISKDLERIFELFPILKERENQVSGTLSGGEQQMLTIGRALMSRPKLMLLDEPSLGLAPLVVSEIFEVIRRLKREGATLLLVEQNARAALKTADRAYVMENGMITIEGGALELLHQERITMAYLGKKTKKRDEV